MPTPDAVTYKEVTRQQWQSAAEAWHRWEPTLRVLLGEATEVMLDLGRIGRGRRVLDVAAGAGEPALTAARRVGPTGHVLATDISSNILALADVVARAHGLDHIVETCVMDGEALELPDVSFDAVISRLGIMYFPDLPRGLAEMYRVLRPGGRAAVVVFSRPERNGFISVPVSILRQRARLAPPGPGEPGPFSLSQPGVLEAAFSSAGFADVVVRVVSATVQLRSASECLRWERESFGALHAMLAGLPQSERDAAWDEVGTALRHFEGPDGFAAPGELLVVGGSR